MSKNYSQRFKETKKCINVKDVYCTPPVKEEGIIMSNYRAMYSLLKYHCWSLTLLGFDLMFLEWFLFSTGISKKN